MPLPFAMPTTVQCIRGRIQTVCFYGRVQMGQKLWVSLAWSMIWMRLGHRQRVMIGQLIQNAYSKQG